MKIHWNPRKLKIRVCQTHTQNYHKTIHFSKAWIFAYILIMISEWCDKYFCDYESLNSRSCIIRYFRFTLEICIISWYLGKAEKKAPIHPDLKLTSWKLSFSKLSTDINFPSRFVPLFIVNCEWNKKDHLKIVLRNNDDHHMKEKYHRSILNASS